MRLRKKQCICRENSKYALDENFHGHFFLRRKVWTRKKITITITRKNDAFVAKIVNTRLTKIFMAIFSPDERLPSSATLVGCLHKGTKRPRRQCVMLIKLMDGICVSW